MRALSNGSHSVPADLDSRSWADTLAPLVSGMEAVSTKLRVPSEHIAWVQASDGLTNRTKVRSQALINPSEPITVARSLAEALASSYLELRRIFSALGEASSRGATAAIMANGFLRAALGPAGDVFPSAPPLPPPMADILVRLESLATSQAQVSAAVGNLIRQGTPAPTTLSCT